MGNEELDKGGQQREDRGQVRLARAPEAAYQYNTRQANRTIFFISLFSFSFWAQGGPHLLFLNQKSPFSFDAPYKIQIHV